MSKNVSIKIPGGFKDIKATMFFESEYKGEKFYVLMGSGEVFALKKDEKLGYLNVVLPSKNAYNELVEPINNDFKNGLNLNERLISLDDAPSIVWVDIPFEQIYGMKSVWDEKEINKVNYFKEQHFYFLFSFLDDKLTNFKQAFSPFGVVENASERDEVIFENRISLLEPYLDEIKDSFSNPFFNFVITIKDGKIRKFAKYFSYLDILEEDDEQRFFISFVPVFNEEMRNEIEKNNKISILGDFLGKKMTQKDFKRIFSDGLSEKRTLITDNMIFEPDSSGLSKYRK